MSKEKKNQQADNQQAENEAQQKNHGSENGAQQTTGEAEKAENSQNQSKEAEQEPQAQQPEESPEEKLQRELAEQKDKYLRLYAEFDNFRKRTARERVELEKTAGSKVIQEMLPVLDDFERALKSMETAEDLESVKEGVEIIFHKFYKVLEGEGLQPIETIGKDFDPDTSEAVTQVPGQPEDQKGKVIDEIEKGYTLNERIIRYAKVVTGA